MRPPTTVGRLTVPERQVPLAASRGEVFADLVQDSVERLERRWPQLADIDFLVLDVPRPAEAGPRVVPDAVPAERPG